MSLSARRAWIEIQRSPKRLPRSSVALRKESVDRNIIFLYYTTKNTHVALRKESVDRNTKVTQAVTKVIWSLSARRAWIEIKSLRFASCSFRSLSARRAWIEISKLQHSIDIISVALRKESVDRNREQFKYVVQCRSRSPQGERG